MVCARLHSAALQEAGHAAPALHKGMDTSCFSCNDKPLVANHALVKEYSLVSVSCDQSYCERHKCLNFAEVVQPQPQKESGISIPLLL